MSSPGSNHAGRQVDGAGEVHLSTPTSSRADLEALSRIP
jgi:hypothetical protein